MAPAFKLGPRITQHRHNSLARTYVRFSLVTDKQKFGFGRELDVLRATNDADDDSVTKEGGIEPKYLAAIGLFVFGCLYDFFVTHGGQPYLQHPI